ncbi:MAG: MBL fold metallo-hydrolase [Chloroflexota bacterium]|nr:MBL fold metallo-hydrolase [Chloroflexota bacterium]MDE2703204.1 MBL fold metallo-hydrolase [Chloroflexota bacterium]MDE2936515.1 MBL fold metallo-hydrolase [Chloroflexota bacterium]
MASCQISHPGHATCLIELDGRVLLTDPLLADRIFSIRRICPTVDPACLPNIDLVLISHLHHDHCHPESMRALNGNPTYLVPHGGGEFLARHSIGPLVEAGPGDQLELLGLQITCLAVDHSGERVPFGPHAPALAFEICGSRRIYFVGDTGYFEPMRPGPQPLDVALLPVAGWGSSLGPGHLDPQEAARAANHLRPRWVIPIHWGAYRNVLPTITSAGQTPGPAQQFVDALETLTADIEPVVLRPGTADRLAL